MRHAKLYADAARNLGLLEEPDLSLAAGDEADEAVTTYVEQVEKIFATSRRSGVSWRPTPSREEEASTT